MSETQPPGPDLPWGTVTHSALAPYADGDDLDLYPDFHLVKDLVVTLTLYITTGGSGKPLDAAVWSHDGVSHTFVPAQIKGSYDDAGKLRLLKDGKTMSDSTDLRIMSNDAPNVQPTGTYWHVQWSNARLKAGWFHLPNGGTVDLSSVVLGSVRPGEAGRVFADLLQAASELQDVIDRGWDGPSGPGNWNTLLNKPVVVAAGATQAEARAAINAAEVGSGGTATWPVDGTPDTFTPTAHKASHASGGADAITPAAIGAATSAQGGRADTALQSVTKADVGLNNVNNTADANKPVSNSTQSAIDGRALMEVRWTGTAWPARTAGAPFGVVFLSTNDKDATAPPSDSLVVGDRWTRHPDAI